jgi:uncharacterized DUF497 family protein
MRIKAEVTSKSMGLIFIPHKVLWNDSNLIEIPANTTDEPRYLVVGLLNGKHWSGVITYRGTNIRIISVRRSRKVEVNLYEST